MDSDIKTWLFDILQAIEDIESFYTLVKLLKTEVYSLSIGGF